MNQLLHTPEGVRDIYGVECARKLEVESKIHDVFNSYGFNDISTPSFEFFDIFNKERGSVPSKEMFKFFDKYNNTVVLRPDFTPQVARLAAKYFGEETGPVKICYKGKTFVNTSSYQARLKETMQMGTELIGDSSVEADAQSVALLIESLLSAGLKEFYVEIGQVKFFKGLVEEAGINDEVADELLRLIQEKNYFGVEELINNSGVDSSFREIFLELPSLFGSVEILDKAAALTTNPLSTLAINKLRRVYDILKIYGYEKYINFDLGMLSTLGYYTGIIFKAYTYGTGEFIANGGRYDKLISQFGMDRPSVGFSITIDYLLIAMERQNLFEENNEKDSYVMVYDDKDIMSAISLANKYRANKTVVNMLCRQDSNSDEYYTEYAKRQGATHLVIVRGNNNVVTIQL